MPNSSPSSDHDTDTANDNPAALLAWFVAMGVDEAQGEDPIDRLAVQAPAHSVTVPPFSAHPNSAKQHAAGLGPHPVSAVPVGNTSYEESIKKAHALAEACNSIADLKKALEAFTGCELKQTATNTVFCTGIETSPLLVISAAPGASEDRSGIAYQDTNGRLLDNMLGAIGFSRETNCLLSYIVPWRPLGNKNPDTHALALCRPFTMRLIEIVKPTALLLLGSASTQCLLEKEATISHLRGKWQTLVLKGHTIATMPSYHPDYLLKHPRYKRDSWQDLLSLKKTLERLQT